MTDAPHAVRAEELARRLEADPAAGLSEEEAARRLEDWGPNRLSRAGRPPYLALALRQLADPLVLLLVAAAAVSAAIGETLEGIAITAIVVLNGTLGFVQEATAQRAVLALREAIARSASVVRTGRERDVPVEDLVPGDLVVLREGDRVPADARIITAQRLEVDESALTGESLPVEKRSRPVPAATLLADRASMVFSGTAVTRGRATALVTATGDETEIGLIAELTAQAKPPPTPLQRRLAGLARGLVAVGALLVVGLGGAMLARGSSLEEAFLVGAAVAVAAVPEGLAATVTIALALGAREMAARGAIVRSLPAVETLGDATVIASDKTGTLTQNRLRVAHALPTEGRGEDELLAAAALASSAELVTTPDGVRAAGDPVDGAIVLAASERGLDPRRLRAGRQLVAEIPFDPERRRMTTVWAEDGGVRVLVKGAPEVVLERCDSDHAERQRLTAAVEAWAADGLRVLAVAERRDAAVTSVEEADLEVGLAPLGLVALHDPLRPGAADAIDEARRAGLDVRLLTGDHPATAGHIARALRVPEDRVHARVTPADKLELVERLQREAETVAVTGDGVNDAPALRRADVGVAMGLAGTEAARESADLVLTDDDFSTIVAAIAEGRRILDNIRKFVAFLLSANLGEVVLFALAVPAGLGAPMTVVQVLSVNVLTDGLPALALARDPASAEAMARGPRRGPALLSRELWGALALVGVLVGVAALSAYLVGRALDDGAAQTMAYATVALAELAFVFSCRELRRPAWRAPRNALLVGAVALSAVFLAVTIYVPALHEPFGTVSLGPLELLVVAALALVPFAAVEGAKHALRERIPAA